VDTLLGLLAGLAACAAGFGSWRLGGLLGRRLGKGAGETVAAASLLLTLLLVWFFRWSGARYSPALALSPLVYLEFAYFLPTLALFLGLAAKRVPRPETGRALGFLAGVIALYAGFHLYLAADARSLPQLSSSPPPAEVQAQTTGWSCGAASCVTLLQAHGIPSTEREMGELCMTLPYRGTTLPRFVRGLTLKLRRSGSPLRVRAADDLEVADLETFPLPALLGIRGSILVGHAVVLLGRTPSGRWRVGDPLEGGKVVEVTREELAARFAGEAIALEP
jgi:hypothetical protein